MPALTGRRRIRFLVIPSGARNLALVCYNGTARFLAACGFPEKHVIPGKAGIGRISHRQWTPAFVGVARRV